jgi:hypothetical protein
MARYLKRELDVETLPGVVLGHRHIPVNAKYAQAAE